MATSDEMSAMPSFKEKTTVYEAYVKVSKKLSKHLAQMQAIQEQVNSAKSASAKSAGKYYRAVKHKISDDEFLSKSVQDELVKRRAKVKDLNDLKKSRKRMRSQV